MQIKKTIIISILLFCLISTAGTAAELKNPEAFVDFIYQNYAKNDFALVYDNFAAELKRTLEKEKYLDFQKNNFNQYNLEFSDIEIGNPEKIDFAEIKNKFDYAQDFGEYYIVEVSYLLDFKYFGSREKRSGKSVYIRKINKDLQLFWDYETAMNDENNSNGTD